MQSRMAWLISLARLYNVFPVLLLCSHIDPAQVSISGLCLSDAIVFVDLAEVLVWSIVVIGWLPVYFMQAEQSGHRRGRLNQA